MAADPSCWLSIIGLTEAGLDGLTVEAREALAQADSVFGAPRHLALAEVDARGQAWPVPFSIAPLLARRGSKVVALVSGDPFWFGAGSTIARDLPAKEFIVYPAPSVFSLVAARLGWPLEEVTCLGLHARPLEEARQALYAGARLFCLMRDGKAPAELAHFLTIQGFGDSTLHVLESLGGPQERIRLTEASRFSLEGVSAPVMVAVEVKGNGALPRAAGLPDDAFAHDGQITRAPIRALTLSALAPQAGALLWDIGAGSGSIGIEWCLAGGRTIALEPKAERCENIRTNIARFGLSRRFTLLEAHAPRALVDLPAPDAVFIGGGADADLLERVWASLPPQGRLVMNAVTLETETLLMGAQAAKGGALLRIDLATMAPLGRMRGWQPQRPIVQWSVVKP